MTVDGDGRMNGKKKKKRTTKGDMSSSVQTNKKRVFSGERTG